MLRKQRYVAAQQLSRLELRGHQKWGQPPGPWQRNSDRFEFLCNTGTLPADISRHTRAMVASAPRVRFECLYGSQRGSQCRRVRRRPRPDRPGAGTPRRSRRLVRRRDRPSPRPAVAAHLLLLGGRAARMATAERHRDPDRGTHRLGQDRTPHPTAVLRAVQAGPARGAAAGSGARARRACRTGGTACGGTGRRIAHLRRRRRRYQGPAHPRLASRRQRARHLRRRRDRGADGDRRRGPAAGLAAGERREQRRAALVPVLGPAR